MTRPTGDNTEDFPGLDKQIDPAARSATSFFRLLNLLAKAIRGKDEQPSAPGTLKLWSNRPGHNAIETILLVLLSFWLTAGTIALAIAERFGDEAGGIVLAIVAAAPLASLTLHVVAFGSAMTAIGIGKMIGSRYTERLTLFLSLSTLTTVALVAISKSPTCPATWLVTGPWLLWALANIGSWVLLQMLDLTAQLSTIGDAE